MFKPSTPFGQTTNTGGFGRFTDNPFNTQSSMFGKPTTTGFAQPAFGAPTTSGLFGSTMQTSNSLFGTSTAVPTFGQAQTTQPSFGFGTAAQPSTNLFGAQPSTSTGLFGASTSAFGQNKPAFGSTFGTTTNTGLFGAQPAPAANNLFGSAAQPATPFGASTGAFGVTAQPTGTVIKFQPITGTDTLQKGSNSQPINTRHYCITCMKEYEGKSLEELRYEDYMANRKGPQQGTSLFGQTPAQPSLFGAAPASTGMFGAPATENKSLFGTPTSTLGGFGTSGGGVFGTQAPASTSLFGAKPTGFGATTTTTATGFGFGASTTPNLFSTQQQPFGAASTTPSLFGQAGTTQPTTGFGTTPAFGSTFGAPQNQSIGLFGAQAKPATTFGLGTTAPATGFSFGQTTTAGTTLFGAKPATTGFGTTGFGTAAPTFGAPQAATSLFNKPATSSFNFGGTTNTLGGNTLNTGTSLFGTTQPKPGGLFGTTPSTGMFGTTGAFGSTGSTFGTGSTGLGGSTLSAPSMFGSTAAPAPVAPQPAHSAILALASLPFADSPLYRSLLPAVKKDNQLKSNAVTQKALLASNDLKVSPKSDTKIKLRSLISQQATKSLFEGLDESPTVVNSLSSVRTLALKPRELNRSVPDTFADAISKEPRNNQSITDASETVSNKENRRVSFSLPLETPMRDSDGESFYIRRDPLFKPQRTNRESRLDELEPAANSTVVEDDTDLQKGSKSNESTPNQSKSQESSLDSSANNTKQSGGSLDVTHGYLNDASEVDEGWVPHATGIILRRVDYYTIPSLDDLQSLIAEDGSCFVDNFCIGRYGYGNLFYDETMDVAGLDIDSIVHFRHKEVTVYPDESLKPEVGKGLNRKCQVTLEQVWPTDKQSHEVIRDPEQLLTLRYEDKLRRCTTKMGAHFIEYRPLTGSWVFKVDHFSKYGLSDSEDEEEIVKVAAASKALPPHLLPAPPVKQSTPHAAVKTTASTILSPIPPPKQQCFSLMDSHSGGAATFTVTNPITDKSMGTQDLSLDVDMDDDDDVDDARDMMNSPWSLAGAQVDSHRVQLMKSSLFHSQAAGDDDLNELSKLDEVTSCVLGLPKMLSLSSSMVQSKTKLNTSLLPGETFDLAAPVLPPLVIPRPQTVSRRHPDAVIPYVKSAAGKMGTRFPCECSLMKGRSFRVGWGPSSTAVCLTTKRKADRLNISLGSRGELDYSPTLIQQFSLYPQKSMFKDTIEKHLEIELRYNCIRGEEDGCPVLSVASGVTALHKHCLLAAELEHLGGAGLSYSHQVWGLCGALWGDLPALSSYEDATSHKTLMMRREALTEWLRRCAEPHVQKEIDTDNELAAIFARLSGNEIAKACEMSQKNGEHYTALMLCSGQAGKRLIQEQLKEWADVAADRYIDEDRLRIYTVSAGLPIMQTSSDVLNCCKGLDWKRVFALHYWYTCSPVAAISDVVTRYEAAFSGSETYADAPHPPYCADVRTSSGQVIYDLCFHLLKLYSKRSHPLEPLLNPATHTADPLDCRLSWLMMQTLASLGYSHVSTLSSAVLTTSFAAQLEAYGLWHWAIFVLLHLKHSARRKQAVHEYLNRHVTLLEGRELTEEEAFVAEDLGVAAEWIYSAKALRALSSCEYDDAAHYLLLACEWNQAHETIITHIAPDLVINENFEYLEELLEQLAPHAHSVAEWPQQGQLLLDFLDIRRSVTLALEERDAGQLESKLPKLASVCERVVRWPTPTAKHRLCQAEIAKGTAHIYLSVKQFDSSASSLRDARAMVSRLPLPQDYLLEEMELIKRAELAVQ